MSYDDKPHGYEPEKWLSYLSSIFIDVEYYDDKLGFCCEEAYTTYKIGNYKKKTNPQWGVDFIYFKLGDATVFMRHFYILPYLLLLKPSTKEDYEKWFNSGTLVHHHLYFAPKIGNLIVHYIKRHFPNFVKN